MAFIGSHVASEVDFAAWGLESKTVFIILLFKMYVCVCMAVTHDEVVAAIDAGAASREAVTRSCRAGGDCGACHGMIDDMLEERAERAESGADLISPARLSRHRAA